MTSSSNSTTTKDSSNQYKDFFEKHSIKVEEPKFNLNPVAPCDDKLIEQTLTDLKVYFEEGETFNEQYAEWVKSFGPGTLGRALILAPTSNMGGGADIRLHALLMHNRFSDEHFKVNHNWDMKSLLAFAKDSVEGMWFGWCTKGDRKSFDKVYCFDDKADSDPPRKVADTFDEFLLEVALGTVMVDMDLKRPKNVTDGEAEDSDDDPEYQVPKVFRKCAGSRF